MMSESHVKLQGLWKCDYKKYVLLQAIRFTSYKFWSSGRTIANNLTHIEALW